MYFQLLSLKLCCYPQRVFYVVPAPVNRRLHALTKPKPLQDAVEARGSSFCTNCQGTLITYYANGFLLHLPAHQLKPPPSMLYWNKNKKTPETVFKPALHKRRKALQIKGNNKNIWKPSYHSHIMS